MICRKAEPYMEDFIENKLELKDLKFFVSHLEECKCCREELDLRYMATTGLKKLDEGQYCDIEEETKALLENGRRDIESSEKMNLILPISLGVLIFIVILILVGIYF